MSRVLRRRLLIALAATGCTVLLAEIGFRLLEDRLGLKQRVADGRALLLEGELRRFEAAPYTVYQRPPGDPEVNALGFLGPEWPLEKAPGVPRILCLGGSTTEANAGSSYPLALEGALEAATGHDFEVLNAGMSGWTTAESLTSWFLRLQDYEPDLVLLHFAINDLDPRFRADFVSDYTHWRRTLRGGTTGVLDRLLATWSDGYVYLRSKAENNIREVSSFPAREFDPLIKEGKLRPETSLPFRRNTLSIATGARSRGALVALMTMPLRPGDANQEEWYYGVAEHNQHLRELCAEHGFLLIDAERGFAGRPELAKEFLDICHLKRAGNRAKAEMAAKVLLEEWIPHLAAANAPVPGR